MKKQRELIANCGLLKKKAGARANPHRKIKNLSQSYNYAHWRKTYNKIKMDFFRFPVCDTHFLINFNKF